MPLQASRDDQKPIALQRLEEMTRLCHIETRTVVTDEVTGHRFACWIAPNPNSARAL
jgi:hypothetical protein